ncbi:hypothetical protein C8J56DRAFT_1048413 [Mycena floridula]|nr:hypothetical protein C8J56DRAFT_1048413 [Mycena floridula]
MSQIPLLSQPKPRASRVAQPVKYNFSDLTPEGLFSHSTAYLATNSNSPITNEPIEFPAFIPEAPSCATSILYPEKPSQYKLDLASSKYNKTWESFDAFQVWLLAEQKQMTIELRNTHKTAGGAAYQWSYRYA